MPDTDQARAMGSGDGPLSSWVAGCIVFGASAAVLVLEITALRLIAPYVGLTLETNTAVIGLALAAIAVGAWAGGASADQGSPRRSIGPLLIAGGALIMCVSPIVRLVTSWVGPNESAGAALLVAAVTVFLPAALLSAVPPMVTKLQLASLDHTGAVVGRLSGLGTVGAIAATFLTGFVLVAVIPTSTILLSTGVLLIIGGIGLAVSVRGSGEGPDRGRRKPPARIVAVLALAIVAGSLGVVVPSPCDVETKYHCASVQTDPERPDGRVLVLDSLRHSYVDLTDPTYLQYAYVRSIAAALDTVGVPGAALDALHIGGGGMTVPRYLLQTRPGTQNLVVEIDPGVVQVDRDLLALPAVPGLEVQVGDGRIAVTGLATDAYDVVVGDAFGGVAVPWHLTTVEAMTDIRRVLRADGLFALNVIDYGPLNFARAEIATVASVFDYVAVIVRPDALDGDGGNIVVLAADQSIAQAAVADALLAQQAPMGIVPQAELDDFVGTDPLVLTDDYAPVDQLLTTVA